MYVETVAGFASFYVFRMFLVMRVKREKWVKSCFWFWGCVCRDCRLWLALEMFTGSWVVCI